MIAYTVRPLTPSARNKMTGKGRDSSAFSANWTSTESLLDRELRQLGARNVVLMLDVGEGDIRIDGRIRSTARPASPFAALAFHSRTKGDLLFCCSRFRTWQDNVRGIALGLEALRKVDRYGIITSDEQYSGFRALPAPEHATYGHTDPVERAWQVIADAARVPVQTARDDPRTVYRMARKATHPDQHPGEDIDPAAFRAVIEAGKILKL